jgi:hypothetical protein
MRFFRFSGYLILALVLLLGPLYGAGRIILPEWIKGQMASALPKGAKLSIGEMFSTAKMGVLYKNIVFELEDGSLSISADDLLIEPNLSFSKPANISIGKGSVKSGETDIFIKDFDAALVLGNVKASELSLFGKIKKIEGEEKTILSNIDFLIQGLSSLEKTITANAKYLNLKLIAPKGPVSVDLSDISLKASLGKALSLALSAEQSKLDLSSLGAGNPNRILNGKNVLIDVNLLEDEHWVLPIKAKIGELSSPVGHLGSSLKLQAKGIWKYAQQQCSVSGIMAGNPECGKMTDVVDIGLKFEEGTGNLYFIADGYCVTPNAGCPQAIESLIRTKNTAHILSKVILSGVLDPIVGGIILGALLSAPEADSPEYDHQASIKVEGNRVFLNGKPII